MYYFLIIVHIIVSVFLILVVLLQSGKSADLAGVFGGGLGSQTAFGPRGAANALTKATTWSAVVFMITSMTLSIMAYKRPAARSVLGGIKTTTTTQPTKAPAQQPPQNEPKQGLTPR
jgi:preprotein translocase subunit SecG